MHARFQATLLATLLATASALSADTTDSPPASRQHDVTREGSDFSDSKTTKLVMLGSGTPIPLIERSGPALAVVVNEHAYLIDAGEGSWRASQAATPKYGGRIAGLAEKHLDKLFLTHHHIDHISNLPAIIYLPWYLGADRQMDIYGPRNTAKIVGHILDAYQYVIDAGEISGMKYEAPVIARGHDILKSGPVYKDDRISVDAFKVLHGNMPNSFAYRFTTPDKVIVISGDKRPTPGFAQWAQGADILVHEVYTVGGLENAPARVPQITATYHTSTRELAEIANTVKPRLLVLYHVMNYSGRPNGPVEEIAAAGYKGKDRKSVV